MIIFLYGPDTFRSRARLRVLVDEFKKRHDPQGYNIASFDSETANAGEMRDAILAAPFLATKRMVMIENIFGETDVEEMLFGLVREGRIPDDVVVVLWHGEIPKKKSALCDALKKEKLAKEYPVPTVKEKIQWIMQEAQKNSTAIDPSAAALLAEHSSDLWRASRLLNRISAAADGHIQTKDVEAALPAVYDENTFHLLDALFAKKHKEAFALLQAQWENGASPHELAGLFAWQVQLLCAARAALDEGGTSSAVFAKEYGVHPFAAEKTFRLARSYSLPKLKEAHECLLLLDQELKTGVAEPHFLIEQFVAEW